MAIVGVNPVQEEPKKSKLETFVKYASLGADMAQTGLKGYGIVKSLPVTTTAVASQIGDK